MGFDPRQHPRGHDGQFTRVYATPNRTVDSAASAESRFHMCDGEMLQAGDLQPHANTEGIWDGNLERSRSYTTTCTDEEWETLKSQLAKSCDALNQDSILAVRDNPEGKSRRYVLDGLDSRQAAQAFRDLAETDPFDGTEEYYGFGGTYIDGHVECIGVDNDKRTKINFDRLKDWCDRHDVSHTEHDEACDAALPGNTHTPEEQAKKDKEIEADAVKNGLIRPGSDDLRTDPALANTPDALAEWLERPVRRKQ